jgi:YrbI family 3-deoxy-D-manno-octulosonate 8-phosphate phosphatase
MFEKIKILVLDFDGVMTDNSVYLDAEGNEYVRCNRSDGLGIRMLKEAGIGVLVISSEENNVAHARCEKLGIQCITGTTEKLIALKGQLSKKQIPLSNVCYIGNDINDIECIRTVGIGVAVKDSHAEILKVARYVTEHKGGKGAVREICDKILQERR